MKKKRDDELTVPTLKEYFYSFLIALVGLILIIFIAITVLFINSKPSKRCLNTYLPNQSQVEEFANFSLPNSYTNLDYEINALGGYKPAKVICSVYVGFGFSPDDLQELLDSTMISNVNENPQNDLQGHSIYLAKNNLGWDLSGEILVGSFDFSEQCPHGNQVLLVNQTHLDSWNGYIIFRQQECYE